MTENITSLPCDEATIERIKTTMRRSDEEALALLDATMPQHPADARLALLRGSIYAHQGRYAGAFADLSQAIVIAPELHAARFMLGYLELCHKGPVQALAVWEPLTALPEDHPLGDFSRGLTRLLTGDIPQARAYLHRGLQHNAEYPELTPFVQSLIERSHALVDDGTAPAAQDANDVPEAQESDDFGSGHHLLLGDYLARRDH